MAPEIFCYGESSFDSDIFSLHVVAWEVIAVDNFIVISRT